MLKVIGAPWYHYIWEQNGTKQHRTVAIVVDCVKEGQQAVICVANRQSLEVDLVVQHWRQAGTN